MKKSIWIAGVLAASAVATGAIVTQAPAPEPAHRDLTLMRPALKIERAGGKLRIRGGWRVLRPSGAGVDHDVRVRLTTTRPGGGDTAPPVELSRIAYRRDHGEAVYPIDKDLDIDATGLDVTVSAVDRETGWVFASFTSHGK